MILPTKHLKLSSSLLNVGAILIRQMDDTQTVSLLWDKSRILPEIRSFERFTLGLDLLYSMGLIDFEDGLIKRLKQ
ncbi:MAG: hypothetical protein GF364_15615 [Candidatus Lokiarchaeota archaeon]|nr:hypothetical protein [Candidatus Lokiarchaeota archaeon]